jgi:hypothetical protein
VKLVVAALLAATVVASTAVPASAAEVKKCGNYGFPEGYDGHKPIFTPEEIVGGGIYDIRTRVARCRTARRMVRRFWAGRWGDCDPTCRRGRFRCRNRQTGDEVWVMRCRAKGDRVVRFEYGA